jgi:hypothetical protein
MRPEPEVGHSLASSTEVKKEGIYTSTPLYVFVAQTGTTLPFGENKYKKKNNKIKLIGIEKDVDSVI